MRRSYLTLGLGAACTFVSAQAQTASTGPAVSIELTAAQAAEGKTAYDRACRQCHGGDLDDGDFAPPLRGSVFLRKWGGKSVAELFTYTGTRMPSDAPGSLGTRAYTSIVAYILQSNNIAPGVHELASTKRELSAMRIPGQTREAPGGGLSPGVSLPNQLPRSALLGRITPVTPAILAKPPASEWLTWRRTSRRPGVQPAETDRPDKC